MRRAAQEPLLPPTAANLPLRPAAPRRAPTSAAFIYVERVLRRTGWPLRTSTWRRLLLCALLEAEKAQLESPTWNSDLALALPSLGLAIGAAELAELEAAFVRALGWALHIGVREYANYFFCLTAQAHDAGASPRGRRAVGRAGAPAAAWWPGSASAPVDGLGASEGGARARAIAALDLARAGARQGIGSCEAAAAAAEPGPAAPPGGSGSAGGGHLPQSPHRPHPPRPPRPRLPRIPPSASAEACAACACAYGAGWGAASE